jgi:hypothetical protein
MLCRLLASLVAAVSLTAVPGRPEGLHYGTGRPQGLHYEVPGGPGGLRYGTTVAAAKTAVAAEDPSARTLLALASRYVATFVDRFSNVVADEHYVQDWKTNTGVPLMHRETTADFLLTRVSDSNTWLAFRDVLTDNGAPVRDHDDRLTKLFLQPGASSVQTLDQAKAIAAESARYNIGNLQRTVNHPLFVLIFLQPANQSHFAFTVDKRDKNIGENVWILEYKETGRPTLIRGTKDKDAPARGRIWIDAVTGRIVRTVLQVEDNLQSTEITANFLNDDRFQIDVPVDMEEQYAIKAGAGKVNARATYEHFRHWEVKTEERVK